MNPAVARLAMSSGAGTWKRFVATAAGIALGVALLFTLLGASSALHLRDERTMWTSAATTDSTDADGQPISLTPDTVLLGTRLTLFDGQPVQEMMLALSPDNRVELPGGLPALAPGESYVSPALAALIAAVPSDQLGDRFGTVAAELPTRLLEGPDQLIAIHFLDEATMRARGTPWLVSSFAGVVSGNNAGYQVVLAVGAIALVIPVVLLISIVTQLGAAQRRERFQTLRLIGAKPRNVAELAAGEMGAMAAVGAVVGWGVAYLVRPLAAQVSINSTRFYTDDLAVSAPTVAAVLVGVVLIASLVAAWRVQREGIGPLGATRQNQERPPRASRVIPLVLGAALIVASAPRSIDSAARQSLAIVGFAVLCVGIIMIGPWFVRLVSGALSRHANSAATVIASSWFRRHPVAAFRSVAGLVVAMFTVSVFSGMASVVGQTTAVPELPGLLTADAAYGQLSPTADADTVQRQASGVEGVTATVVGYYWEQDADSTVVSAADARTLGFAAVPDTGCVAFNRDFVMPQAAVPATLLATDCATRGDPVVLFVRTDGSSAAMNRAKTWSATSSDMASSLNTRSDGTEMASLGAIATLASMAYLGVLIAVAIAGLSLAVSSSAAVLDHRRTFGLMRLIGMRHQTLWKVVSIEALVPLLATVVVTVAAGFAVAWVLIEGWATNLSMSWPDPRYYLAIGAATLIAVAAVCATFPTVRNGTRAQTTRFE